MEKISDKFIDDGTGFKPIEFANLKCKDCKYRIPQSVKQCGLYRTKPVSLFIKNECPDYEKED